MGFLSDLFHRPYPAFAGQEIEKLLEELVRIGKLEDFLSERPGGAFNMQCRHMRARDIGKRLDELGGIELMEYMQKKVRKRLNPTLSEHLGYAWSDIGKWAP
ncbi:MAG: hypothetical protein LWX83_11805 [Anaerolineae bacterium]|nr:hypothetical protein [Anaerolineae bacterium]